MKITFGIKYIGKNLENTIQEDKRYFKWALEQDNLIKNDEEKKYIENYFDNNSADEYYFNFGKYKGKSLTWIRKYKFSYLLHLKKEFDKNENTATGNGKDNFEDLRNILNDIFSKDDSIENLELEVA